MSGVELVAPPSATVAKSRKPVAPNDVDDNEDDLSPIEQVRLTVTNTDDPTLHVWTFRMWFLGVVSCALLSFLNQFFAYRTEPLIITQITVQVATLPIGRFMAAMLPIAEFRIPGLGSRMFSLNPGPFNIKEHVLISIFANAGSVFGSGTAYAVDIVTIIKAFYLRSISFFVGWLLIITTQEREKNMMLGGHLSRNPKGDLNPTPPQTPAAHLTSHRLRKKGIGIKTWLVVNSTGQAQLVDAGKHLIKRRTGLSARDLRILDPSLSYPSTVIGRERAVVIKLEHIKGVITAKDVWLLNSKDPAVTPFVEELKRRCSHHHQVNAMKVNRSSGGEEQSEEALHQIFEATHQEGLHSGDVKQQHDRSETLPFEFVALEACLEAACTSLDDEAKALEQEANPALDKLLSKITTRHLERVRQIKARLVALTGRVQKIRNEIENLLEDGDMAEMYLTSKLLQDEKEKPSSSSSSIAGEDDEFHEPDKEERNRKGDDEITPDESSSSPRSSLDDDEKEGRVKDSNSHGSFSGSRRSSKHLDVAELEMLLEAYFVQLDGTLNELSALSEYIRDTEDYVNIMLDDKQNNLLQMGVVISTATIFITMFIVVTGIFGMNVKIWLFLNPNPKINNFIWTVSGCTFGTIVLYAIAITWFKYKRLI